jgi:type III pantothenate kinase
MVLLVDAGNTRIKWARAEGEKLGRRYAAAHARLSPADYRRRLFGRHPPERVLIASVAGGRVNRALAAAARRARIKARFVRVPRHGGKLTVGYREPWRWGVDRYVAAVGAVHLFRGVGVCVVGVGTALTVDLIDADGRHRGGVIIPSPALMVESLLNQTHGIRRRARGGGAGGGGFFARSTRSGLAQGSRYAAAALIDRAVEEAEGLLGKRPLAVLTGGEASFVRPLVRNPCVGVPDLVLRGLAVLAREPQRRP